MRNATVPGHPGQRPHLRPPRACANPRCAVCALRAWKEWKGKKENKKERDTPSYIRKAQSAQMGFSRRRIRPRNRLSARKSHSIGLS